MSSDSDAISHFTPLDEMIQVVYQGSARFVIISSVDESSWNVHVGLTGDEGRWWRGRWTEKDVREVVGSKVSGFLLDSFVEKLADTFVKGEISVEGWNAQRDGPIQLVFGTHAKTPVQIPLTELSQREAVVYATKIFVEIALQAQSRRCRLYPSIHDVSSAVPAPAAHGRRTPENVPSHATKHHTPHSVKGKEKATDEQPVTENKYKRKADAAEEEIQALKAELEKAKRQQQAIMTDPSKLLPINRTSQTISKPRGVSLANPTKKARRYKPIEFESDDEE
ncbi:hypothetical protein BD414DRAFT_535457 [Trametes punicea]|nr:hypothetical protein BD414DRAFT_535457 [Trametes punicea]